MTTQRTPNGLKLAAKINGVIASIILFVGLGWGVYNWNFIRTAETTQATVVDLDVHGRPNKYFPVIEYTVDGVQYRQTSHSGSNPSHYQVGDAVTIFYQADEPNRYRIDWFVNLWLAPLLISGAGLLQFILAAIFWILGRRLNSHSRIVVPAYVQSAIDSRNNENNNNASK